MTAKLQSEISALRKFSIYDVVPGKLIDRLAARTKEVKLRGMCSSCGRYLRLRKDGKLYVHNSYYYESRCDGAGKYPEKIEAPCHRCGKLLRIKRLPPLKTKMPKHFALGTVDLCICCGGLDPFLTSTGYWKTSTGYWKVSSYPWTTHGS